MARPGARQAGRGARDRPGRQEAAQEPEERPCWSRWFGGSMSRQTSVLLLVAALCALGATAGFLLGPLFEPSTQEAQPSNEGLGTGGWVVIAAISGAQCSLRLEPS